MANGSEPEPAGIVQQTQWLGPVPPPESLKAFEQTVPGAAERILALAEREALARMEREADQQRADNEARMADIRNYHSRISKGQTVGLIVSIAFLLGAVACAHYHETSIGVALAGVTFVGVVNAIVSPRKR